MSTRVPRGYVAILFEKREPESPLLMKPEFTHVLYGEVLSVGSDVVDVVPGDRVVYQRQSAHPHQQGPISAEYWGREGQVIIVPVVQRMKNYHHLDYEIRQRTQERDAITSQWRGRLDIPKDVQYTAEKHEYEIRRLKRIRAQGARSKAFTREAQSGETRSEGVLAVVHD